VDHGVTHIAGTRWSQNYRGPEHLPRGAAALPKPDPSLPHEHLIGETRPVRMVNAQAQSFIAAKPQIKTVAIRLSEKSGQSELVHTHGLSVVIRKPSDKSWWTNTGSRQEQRVRLAESSVISRRVSTRRRAVSFCD